MLTQFYPPIIGGEERHVRTLAQSMAARGYDVMVATLTTEGAPATEEEGGVKIVRLGGLMQRAGALYSDDSRRHAPPFPDPELSWKLLGLARDFKPDVVHAHNWIVHSYLPVKSVIGAPLVLTLHDYSIVCATKLLVRDGEICSGPSLGKCLSCAAAHYGSAVGTVTTVGNWFSSQLERRLVDKILTVSSFVAEGCALEGGRVPFEVIPNLIPDSYPTEEGHDARVAMLPDEPFIFFAGDLRRHKGLHAIFDAYPTLRNAPPLVVIGRPCPDTPKTIPDNVTLIPGWPHAAIMEAWRRCRFGLVPTAGSDPCPTTVLEGMVCGKPVIGTKAGGIPDMIDDGVTGLLVEPGDAKALAAAMQRLIDDPALCARMSEAAPRKVLDFQSARVIPRIENVYRDVSGQVDVAGETVMSETIGERRSEEQRRAS